MKPLSCIAKAPLAAAVCASSFILLSSSINASEVALVTNGNDAGEGSLRAALNSGATSIVITTSRNIYIQTPLTYSSRDALSLYGQGNTVKTYENINLLEITDGADLTIEDMKFKGPGQYSIEQRGDIGETAGKGIFVDLRNDQTGTVKLVLTKVSVSGVANHGIHISDCSLADDCGSGGGGEGEGSPASISVTLNEVKIDDVGNGKFDADGLRVDERDKGSIFFNSYKSSFTHVGADGVELDEGQNGSVIARINGNKFNNNGNYCDPAILNAFLPNPDEAVFEDGETLLADIPGPITGSPDDSCIEREVDLYDSGFVEEYAFGIDLDDGIDIDEAGKGSIDSLMINTRIEKNLDEGVDYDEEDNGAISATFIDSKASNNNDDGFKLSEADKGSVSGLVYESIAKNNGGKGIVFEEEGKGSLTVVVEASKASNNDDSDNTGIEAVQEDEGSGLLTVIDSQIADGIDADGVTVVNQ